MDVQQPTKQAEHTKHTNYTKHNPHKNSMLSRNNKTRRRSRPQLPSPIRQNSIPKSQEGTSTKIEKESNKHESTSESDDSENCEEDSNFNLTPLPARVPVAPSGAKFRRRVSVKVNLIREGRMAEPANNNNNTTQPSRRNSNGSSTSEKSSKNDTLNPKNRQSSRANSARTRASQFELALTRARNTSKEVGLNDENVSSAESSSSSSSEEDDDLDNEFESRLAKRENIVRVRESEPQVSEEEEEEDDIFMFHKIPAANELGKGTGEWLGLQTATIIEPALKHAPATKDRRRHTCRAASIRRHEQATFQAHQLKLNQYHAKISLLKLRSMALRSAIETENTSKQQLTQPRPGYVSLTTEIKREGGSNATNKTRKEEQGVDDDLMLTVGRIAQNDVHGALQEHQENAAVCLKSILHTAKNEQNELLLAHKLINERVTQLKMDTSELAFELRTTEIKEMEQKSTFYTSEHEYEAVCAEKTKLAKKIPTLKHMMQRASQTEVMTKVRTHSLENALQVHKDQEEEINDLHKTILSQRDQVQYRLQAAQTQLKRMKDRNRKALNAQREAIRSSRALAAYCDDWEGRRQDINTKAKGRDSAINLDEQKNDHNLESINKIATELQNNSTLDMDLHCLGNKTYTDEQVLHILDKLNMRMQDQYKGACGDDNPRLLISNYTSSIGDQPILKPATLVHLALSTIHNKDETTRGLAAARTKHADLIKAKVQLQKSLLTIEKEFGSFEYIVRRSAYEDVHKKIHLAHLSISTLDLEYNNANHTLKIIEQSMDEFLRKLMALEIPISNETEDVTGMLRRKSILQRKLSGGLKMSVTQLASAVTGGTNTTGISTSIPTIPYVRVGGKNSISTNGPNFRDGSISEGHISKTMTSIATWISQNGISETSHSKERVDKNVKRNGSMVHNDNGDMNVPKELQRFQNKMNLVLKICQLLMVNGSKTGHGVASFEVSTVTSIGGAHSNIHSHKKETSFMAVIAAARATRIAAMLARKKLTVTTNAPTGTVVKTKMSHRGSSRENSLISAPRKNLLNAAKSVLAQTNTTGGRRRMSTTFGSFSKVGSSSHIPNLANKVANKSLVPVVAPPVQVVVPAVIVPDLNLIRVPSPKTNVRVAANKWQHHDDAEDDAEIIGGNQTDRFDGATAVSNSRHAKGNRVDDDAIIMREIRREIKNRASALSGRNNGSTRDESSAHSDSVPSVLNAAAFSEAMWGNDE